MNEVKIGTYDGTGAAIDLPLGFVPDLFIVVNTEDGDVIGLSFPGIMAAGTAIDIAAAVAPNADNGFTALDSDTVGQGITIGTDYSENGKTYGYAAFRSGAGAQ